jgi:hypothetical protein
MRTLNKIPIRKHSNQFQDNTYIILNCKWGDFTIRYKDGKYEIINTLRNDYYLVIHRGILKIAYGRAWLRGHRTTLYYVDYDNAIKKLSNEAEKSVGKVEDMSNKLATIFYQTVNTTELERGLAELEAELIGLEE